MCGIQLAGGEWLLGAEITARYGGSLMWLAAAAILGQVFYNMECGRYALYTGEPVFTGFLRSKPGPSFWIGVLFLLSLGSFIPGCPHKPPPRSPLCSWTAFPVRRTAGW